MTNDIIARVHYYPEQFLRTKDFVAEQDYHLAMRRRHNIAHHRWGIVYGLELYEEDDTFYVKPGMAIDGYGREVVVPKTQQLPYGAFDDKGRDVLDVWLSYDRRLSDQAPEGYAGCGNGNGDARYRWQENPIIRLDVPDAAAPERREPWQVPQGDLEFGPSRTPPDDPSREWPIFLGQVQRQRPDPSQPFSLRVDMGNRPYAGLVGEAVLAPSGRARVQIGAERESDKRRFAVFVPGNAADPSLEISEQGTVDIRGQTTMHGKLKMKGGTVEFPVGQAQPSSSCAIYRYSNPNTAEDQLRVQMVGGAPGPNQIVVGFWNEDERVFTECLIINDDCSVVVRGNLVVEGTLDPKKGIAPASFSPEAQAFLTGGVLSGISGASTLLEQLRPGPPKSLAEQAEELIGSQEGLEAFANVLAANPQQLRDLVSEVGGQALDDIIQALTQPATRQDFVDEIVKNWLPAQIALGAISVDDLHDLVDRLLRQPVSRTKVINEMLDFDPAMAEFATSLSTHAAGLNKAIEAMLDENFGKQQLADQLNNEPDTTLRDVLKRMAAADANDVDDFVDTL